jgi:hypothetical protein
LEAIFLNCNQELSLSKRKRVIPAKGCYKPGKKCYKPARITGYLPSFLSLKLKDWKNLYFDYLSG